MSDSHPATLGHNTSTVLSGQVTTVPPGKQQHSNLLTGLCFNRSVFRGSELLLWTGSAAAMFLYNLVVVFLILCRLRRVSPDDNIIPGPRPPAAAGAAAQPLTARAAHQHRGRGDQYWVGGGFKISYHCKVRNSF